MGPISIDIKSKEVSAWGVHAETMGKELENYTLLHCGEYHVSNPDENYSKALDWNIYFLMETPFHNIHNAILFIRKLSASQPFFH